MFQAQGTGTGEIWFQGDKKYKAPSLEPACEGPALELERPLFEEANQHDFYFV